jgi:predicted TIM-barrel fold metal-dependent hydrolase
LPVSKENIVSHASLYQELLEELIATPTVDAHEHLPPEKKALERRVDFFSLFEHYTAGDLVAAGATEADLALWQDRDQPLVRRWLSFKPFFSAIRTGSYARSAQITVRDLLGFDDLNDDTYEPVGRALAEMNKPGLYDRVLRDRCGIRACLECWTMGSEGLPDYFYHLAPGPQVVDAIDQNGVHELEKQSGCSIHGLADWLAAMTTIVEKWRADPKVVGIKSAHAYSRPINFQKRTRHEAELVLNRVLTNECHQLSWQEALPLQDLLMFELVARAEAVGLPMVFHTGLQAGNYGRIANANPLGLQSILEEFPRAKFDLFHGGMPWVRDIAVLAKYFPGVHLNMAWMHIISPAQSCSALSEWLDLLPNTKIFGFGGDYSIVEKVYGHLVLARQNIASVLADKVAAGAYSRAEASLLIRRLMFDNANEFYKLGLKAG